MQFAFPLRKTNREKAWFVVIAGDMIDLNIAQCVPASNFGPSELERVFLSSKKSA